MSFTNIKETSNSEHQKVWSLLPWYVNHSLEPAEHEFVESHVQTCIACRIELNQQQQLFEKIQQTDHLQQVSMVSFAKLKKRVGKQPEPKKMLKPYFHQFSSFVKYTAIAASLLLLAMSLILNSIIVEPELASEYRTLANPTEAGLKQNIVRVVFVGQPEAEQIETLLSGVSGHIINGPSKNAIYEIQIGNQHTFNDAITHLRDSPLVIFAELAH